MKTRILLILLIIAGLSAQFRDTGEQDPRIRFMGSQPSSSIFDLSRVSVSHTFSMNYINTAYGSQLQNEYMAGIKYRISDPLMLRLNLGMSYVPVSSFESQEDQNTDIYLKSATLDYRPSEKFRMVIDFRNIRPGDDLFYSDPYGNFRTAQDGE